VLLEGKTVVLTGASGGIGRALAKGFATQGASLMLAYHQDEAGAEAAAEQVRALGSQARLIQADIADPSAAESIIETAELEFGKIDVLMNNAGIARRAPFLEVNQRDFERVFSVNVMGTFFCSQSAAKRMVTQGWGKIINMSSTVTDLFTSSLVPYSASKAAISSITKSMALALAPHGINVNAIAPGVVMTDTMKIRLNTDANREPILSRTPMLPLLAPTDLVDTVLFLASGLSDHITGQIITIDHGYTLQGQEWDLEAEKEIGR